jgi:DNA polymerase-3 subunit alpha
MIVQSVDIEGVAPSEELSRNIEDLLGEQTVFIEY